jgi:flagellar hook-associated protein FlgK
MNVAFNTAVSGMLSAQSQLSAAARNVVEAASTGQDVIQASVAVKKAEMASKAAAVMVNTTSEMTDTLLDITV